MLAVCRVSAQGMEIITRSPITSRKLLRGDGEGIDSAMAVLLSGRSGETNYSILCFERPIKTDCVGSLCPMMLWPATLKKRRLSMAQFWDAEAYARDGAFVHGLAGGVL